MNAAILDIRLRLVHPSTGWRRRRRVARIVAKLRRHFNVAVSEGTGGDDPSIVILGVASIGRNRREALETLGRVSEALDHHPTAEVVDRRVVEV